MTLGLDVFDFLFGEAQVDVFRLEISMNNFAQPVEVVQPEQALPGHLANDGQRSSFVVVSLDDFEQVDSQDFEHSHEMLSVRSMVQEAVQELHTIAVVSCDVLQLLWLFGVVGLERIEPLFFHPVRGALVENLYFVKGRLKVLRRAPLDLESNVSVIVDILGQPHGREVAPAKLLDDHVSLDEDLADVHAVVAPYLVVWHPLVL